MTVPYIYLTHTTNTPDSVPAKTRKVDSDVQVKGLWVSVNPLINDPCCRHHDQGVSIKQTLYKRKNREGWRLYYVNERDGKIDGHIFHKYVFIPIGEDHDVIKNQCNGHEDFKLRGEFRFGNNQEPMFRKLSKLICKNHPDWVQPETHIHIGTLGLAGTDIGPDSSDENPELLIINGDYDKIGRLLPKFGANRFMHLPWCFDCGKNPEQVEVCQECVYPSEEWKHVEEGSNDSPDAKPKTQKNSKNTHTDSKSLSSKSTVSSTANDEESYDIIYRHYCRAWCQFQCVNPQCKNTWSSAWCYYKNETWTGKTIKHEESVIKGFEWQYCNKCWIRADKNKLDWEDERRWCHGKIQEYREPDGYLERWGGKRFKKPGGGKTMPHVQEKCPMCLRLKKEKYPGTCIAFESDRQKGKVVVTREKWRWAK